MKMQTLCLAAAVAMVCGPLAVHAKGGPAGAPSGGNSAAHVSEQAKSNSNGPNAADREKGQARAEQRRSAQGNAHGKAAKKTQATASDRTASSTTTTVRRNSDGSTTTVERTAR
jgi:hypothetical protein